MKKTYISPSVETVKIQTVGMLANSPLTTTGDSPRQEDFGNETSEIGGNLSRRFGFDLDDDF